MKVICVMFVIALVGCLSVEDGGVAVDETEQREEVPPEDAPDIACVFGDNGDFACCNHGCCWGVVGDQYIQTCGQ